MAYSDCARPTRPCPTSEPSRLYAGSAIGPTPDTAWTLYLCSALAGVALVVAALASLPAGSIP